MIGDSRSSRHGLTVWRPIAEMNSSKPGQLIIISGPSGVGKSTVVRKLFEVCDLPLELSISATTRTPRTGEVDGDDYLFLDPDDFAERVQNGEFLETAEVFGAGEWYGTLEKPVRDLLAEGKQVILEIDVKGALLVLQRFPEAMTIFIHPGTTEELERRLRGRKTEAEDKIQQRLAVADAELEMAPQYDHIIHNENIEATARAICGLLSKTGEQKSCTTN